MAWTCSSGPWLIGPCCSTTCPIRSGSTMKIHSRQKSWLYICTFTDWLEAPYTPPFYRKITELQELEFCSYQDYSRSNFPYRHQFNESCLSPDRPCRMY